MKQLPEKIALDKAIQGQRLYQGQVNIQQMSRLTDLLADANSIVEYSIEFERAKGLLGKAQVKVKTELALICTISENKFMFPVDIESTLGFIDDLEYEHLLDDDMEASWVENGFIKPLEIIEDELILSVPDAPYDEKNSADSSDVEVVFVEEKINPFDVLKKLK